MSLFDAVNNDDIIEEIKELELSKMTPIDALNTLFGIQDKIKKACIMIHAYSYKILYLNYYFQLTTLPSVCLLTQELV